MDQNDAVGHGAEEPLLIIERDAAVAVLTLNRPKQLNALSSGLRREIVAALRTLSAADDVRAIVLTGAGRAFSAGVDLKEPGGFSGKRLEGETKDDARRNLDLVAAFAECRWPIVAAVNGVAITGGLELALLCDVLVASSDARFADTHGKVGLMPVWGLSQRLPRLIGAGRAKEMSLTGNFVDAATAERWGLVSRVVAPDELLDTAKRLAHDMAALDGSILSTLKSVIDDGWALPLAEALAMEAERGNAHNAEVARVARERRQA